VMAVRYLLLSLAAALTCLTLNEAPACPTEHGLIAPATQAFSPDIEDESISTYIGELAASSSYDGSIANTEDGRRSPVETLSTHGRVLIDVMDEGLSSHLGEILPSRVPTAFAAPGVSELTLGSEAKHFLDIEDESVSTYIRDLAAAAASVELAPEGRPESPPTIVRDLTLLDPSQRFNDDLDPATTGSVTLDPWAVHHRRDE
jgi:hypothetical protein